MPFIADRNYASEASQFLAKLKKDRPELETEQLRGRALLWDKKIDRQAQAEFGAGKVAQSAYVYQTKPTHQK